MTYAAMNIRTGVSHAKTISASREEALAKAAAIGLDLRVWYVCAA